MRTGHARCAACLLTALLAAAVFIVAQSCARIVIISYLRNSVQVELPSAPKTPPAQWTKAARNAPIVEGESLRTLANSAAEVELECGSALRLAPEAAMTFSRLRLGTKGVEQTTVSLQAGEAFFTLGKVDSRGFQALVPGGTISLLHGAASLRLDVAQSQPAIIEVLSGNVQVETDGKTASVKAHSSFQLVPGAGVDLIANAKPDSWQKWSQQRDQAFKLALWNSTPLPPVLLDYQPVAPGGVIMPGPDMAGAQDVQETNRANRSADAPRVPACAHD
ncbi:MAG: FecR domain-containing protein [Terriglobales bacterium]